MSLLLIDNSNSRTKFALSDGEELDDWRGAIETSALTPETINSLTENLAIDGVVICSVVPEKAELLKNTISAPHHLISDHSTLSIGIDYPAPSEIGADRLANAEGAFSKYGAPLIVIDSGTAVTFDILEKRKDGVSYTGGVITPGLGLMTDYFLEKTALLPRLIPEEPKSFIGKSTLDAMNIGAITGFRGLTREILTGLEEELGTKPRVIATGGDAELLVKGIKRIERVDPDLTLEGILRIGLLNQDNFINK